MKKILYFSNKNLISQSLHKARVEAQLSQGELAAKIDVYKRQGLHRSGLPHHNRFPQAVPRNEYSDQEADYTQLPAG